MSIIIKLLEGFTNGVRFGALMEEEVFEELLNEIIRSSL